MAHKFSHQACGTVLSSHYCIKKMAWSLNVVMTSSCHVAAGPLHPTNLLNQNEVNIMQWYSQMSGTNQPEWASVLLFWSMYTFSWIAIKHFWLFFTLKFPQGKFGNVMECKSLYMWTLKLYIFVYWLLYIQFITSPQWKYIDAFRLVLEWLSFFIQVWYVIYFIIDIIK